MFRHSSNQAGVDTLKKNGTCTSKHRLAFLKSNFLFDIIIKEILKNVIEIWSRCDIVFLLPPHIYCDYKDAVLSFEIVSI